MERLLEAIQNLQFWLAEHNLRGKAEIIIRVKSNTEMYAGNDVLRRGAPKDWPYFVVEYDTKGTEIMGVPVRFEVEPR